MNTDRDALIDDAEKERQMKMVTDLAKLQQDIQKTISGCFPDALHEQHHNASLKVLFAIADAGWHFARD